MATDIRLDEENGDVVVLDARFVRAEATDLMLDHSERRKVSGGTRRALVHNQDDGLTVNFNGDYPGGVTITGATAINGNNASGVAITGVAEIIPQKPKRQTALSLPTLAVRGGISYEIIGASQVFRPGASHGVSKITVNLADMIKNLQSQIDELDAKVTAMEARLVS
jgi:hypothetical protein